MPGSEVDGGVLADLSHMQLMDASVWCEMAASSLVVQPKCSPSLGTKSFISLSLWPTRVCCNQRTEAAGPLWAHAGEVILPVN